MGNEVILLNQFDQPRPHRGFVLKGRSVFPNQKPSVSYAEGNDISGSIRQEEKTQKSKNSEEDNPAFGCQNPAPEDKVDSENHRSLPERQSSPDTESRSQGLTSVKTKQGRVGMSDNRSNGNQG